MLQVPPAPEDKVVVFLNTLGILPTYYGYILTSSAIWCS
jgi:hypothetical protein